MAMEDNQKERFGAAIGALSETIGGVPLRDTQLLGYWVALKGRLTIDQLEQACAKLLATSRFMPKPVEIIEAAVGSSEDIAATAWEEVMRVCQAIGSYRAVDFEDRRINAAIRSLGGWPLMFDRCNNAENEKWYRREFEQAYRRYLEHGCGDEAGRALPGISEANVVEIVDGQKRFFLRTVFVECKELRRIAAIEQREAPNPLIEWKPSGVTA